MNTPPELQRVRLFLLFEVAVFLLAALVHAGVLLRGFEHAEARIAETVIALVLLAGLVVSWVRPPWTRRAAIVAQAFALLGTLVGIFTIIVGVGPRTVPDAVYHLAVVAVLAWGLLVALGRRYSKTRS